jgi:hypothetical protein
MTERFGSPRPLSVTLVALLLIAAGAVGLLYHAKEIDLRQPFQNDTMWVELVRVLAIVSGVLMLRGHNWARWLAIAWIGFHVAISFFHSWQQVVMHTIVFVVFAFFLFRPAANRYFHAEAEN